MYSSNSLSILTLLIKEILRFIKVGVQTIAGPAISSLLFLGVFSLALGRSVENINNISFEEFIAPGLIMMTILQNSFSNAASSIGQSKTQGNIVDVLMAPLSNFGLTIGYVGGSVVRGILCGIVTYCGVLIFIPISFYSYSALLFYAFMGSIMMGCLGTMVGIWADKWEQQQAISNFIVLPMTFLSGTFYSVSKLPEFWQNLALFNPFFYNIDGFRYAFTGYADSPIILGVFCLIFINIILIYLCFLMFRTGYKLKS